jgi:RNA polymerase sigma-70 factor (ECF subfamily)
MDAREEDWAAAMRAAQQGCGASYARLLGEIAAALRGPVRGRLARFGSSDAETEDVVQEVLIAIHRKRDTWDPARPFLPWLAALTRHRVIDATRRLGRARGRAAAATVDEMADVLPAPTPTPAPLAGERARMIAALPARERGVVAALGLEGQSVAAAATRFAISEGAVRVAFHRGLARLRRMAEAPPNPEISQ